LIAFVVDVMQIEFQFCHNAGVNKFYFDKHILKF
jgi:hypothetical protein